MVNIHKLKSKNKNISRELAKLYKSKHNTTEKIRELEEARSNIKINIQGLRNIKPQGKRPYKKKKNKG